MIFVTGYVLSHQSLNAVVVLSCFAPVLSWLLLEKMRVNFFFLNKLNVLISFIDLKSYSILKLLCILLSVFGS